MSAPDPGLRDEVLAATEKLRWEVGRDFHEQLMETIYTDAARIAGRAVTRSDEKPRFDLDRYGRLAMPNAVTNSVTVLDNAGNRIVEFGAYGNLDSQYVNRDTDRGRAGKPTVATPEIPLGWPTGVGVSEDHIYVNDTYNRRVVRVDKTFAAEAACPIP